MTEHNDVDCEEELGARTARLVALGALLVSAASVVSALYWTLYL